LACECVWEKVVWEEDEGTSETDGSRRMTMLFTRLRVLLSPRVSTCVSFPLPLVFTSMSSIPSSSSSVANHSNPSLYGLASGDPFRLSMLSSRRGARRAG
jgi:hypothetical protein